MVVYSVYLLHGIPNEEVVCIHILVYCVLTIIIIMLLKQAVGMAV